MTQTQSDFVLYPCDSCSQRIFTQRQHLGQAGVCPVCGAEHVVGGAPTVYAEEGVERRRAPRIPVAGAKVELRAGALYAVQDLSEVGLSFRVAGPCTAEMQPGSCVQVTLHAQEQEAAASVFSAVVRQVRGRQGEVRSVGVEFVDLTPSQLSEVRQLVQRLGN